MSRTAIVIGATGLVGKELLQLLLQDGRFSQVKILGRRSAGIHHHKLQEFIVDFEKPAQWKDLVHGDVLFSSLGTTIKAAGSKEAQYKVDHTFQYNVARAAAENGVPVYVLVSSAMADPHSKIFYTKMKGELERDIRQLDFRQIHIMQPGMLDGKRKESRPGETIGTSALHFLNKFGILKKQKPVPAKTLAQAMINVSMKDTDGVNTYTLLQVFEEAG